MFKFLFVGLIIFPSFCLAHPGGKDANGGHTNSKTGQYHCHSKTCRIDSSVNVVSNTYNRDDWKHWSDFDGDCMNTRHEILKSQAISAVKLSPNGCYVSMGVWVDPFSAKTFTRASGLDVDHIIPLKWAHDHGGNIWSAEKKEQFANDPENLIAVDDGLNQQKGAQGPTEWLPPNHNFRCEYLSFWVLLLNKYSELTLTSSEERIFNRQLKACNL